MQTGACLVALTPSADRALAIVNLRNKCAPSAFFPQIDDFKWSVCLHVVGSENTPPRFLSGGAHLLISSMIPPARRCTCGVCAHRSTPPQGENFPQIANLQWSVCLHVVGSGNTPQGPCSIREYTPRFLLNPGIHSKILPCSVGPNAGFASVRAISPLCVGWGSDVKMHPAKKARLQKTHAAKKTTSCKVQT